MVLSRFFQNLATKTRPAPPVWVGRCLEQHFSSRLLTKRYWMEPSVYSTMNKFVVELPPHIPVNEQPQEQALGQSSGQPHHSDWTVYSMDVSTLSFCLHPRVVSWGWELLASFLLLGYNATLISISCCRQLEELLAEKILMIRECM